MEWYVFLILFMLGLAVVMLIRVPVGFAMLGLGALAAVFAFGSVEAASRLVGLSLISSVNSFTFSAIPLFILMGEVLFRSRIAHDALDEISLLLRRVPGRLPMVAVAGGGAFGLLSGSTLANTALFGRTLWPQMRDEGYNEKLAVGSILGSGGLAMILPPSALAILWGGIAQIPIGPLLIAGIVPGLLMAVGYAVVVLAWSARTGRVGEMPSARTLGAALRSGLRHLWAPGVIALFVLGLIFTGVATPTETAALGTALAVVLTVVLGRFRWRDLRASAVGTVRTSAAIFFLVLGSTLYSQLMAYMGATQGLVKWSTGLVSNGLMMLALIMVLLIVLGAFIDQASIMLVTAPLLMPIVSAFGWDPLWFSILVLIILQIGNTSPPFGMSLFVMKGVAPELSMGTIYKAALPWIGSDIAVVLVLVGFPALVTFLPALMQ
ncbi:TRAP transporter large permease [Kocuria tytonicola]|uniref:TRAP transporter large permease n=1 Tax=Kocuria tytonicola TaxID=2055946 RepID=A0A3L9L5H9_9MICC|nr:TRAP transporter large permease [Kocuria tytonicola]RLY93821.1 TRAP transporter large permease [Kocuria tytonicola]